MKSSAIYLLAAISISVSINVNAVGLGENFSAAAGYSSAAGAHLSAGTGNIVSIGAAIPLKAVGTVGAISSELGDALWDAATQPIGEPLPIDDTVHTLSPRPDQALHATP